MIARHWPEWFLQKLGGSWPSSYATFDTETTGFRHNAEDGKPADLVTDFGYCLVHNNQVVERRTIVADWTRAGGISQPWLRERLQNRDRDIAAGGALTGNSYARIAAQGIGPLQAFDEVARLFAHWEKVLGVPVVAHNGYQFDERMLARMMKDLGVDVAWTLGDDRMLDSMALEVASQVWYSSPDRRYKLVPEAKDTLRSYCVKTRSVRPSTGTVKSSLGDHCFAKYGFDRDGVSANVMHGAETDAFCVHLLMQRWREALAGEDVAPLEAPPPAPPPPDPVRPLVPPSVQRYRGQRNS